MTRPLVLLPPARGKSPGGDGPAYARTLGRRHPLATERREVLAALTASAARLDERGVARLCGVAGTEVAAARSGLADLAHAPTMPAHQRYRGVVHMNARLADLDPATLPVEVRIVSALLGLVAPDEPVPAYRIEFAAGVEPLGGLATWWRGRLGPELRRIAEGRRVWDLLPGEHRRMWPAEVRGDLDVVDVRFLRPDGGPANAATTKVAKGRLAAWLLTAPDASPADVAGDLDLGAGWSLAASRGAVIATLEPAGTRR